MDVLVLIDKLDELVATAKNVPMKSMSMSDNRMGVRRTKRRPSRSALRSARASGAGIPRLRMKSSETRMAENESPSIK